MGLNIPRTLDTLATEVDPGETGQVMTARLLLLLGNKLVREWNGVEHTDTVLPKGFESQGRRYKALSGAARATKGANWNGWKLFSLTPASLA